MQLRPVLEGDHFAVNSKSIVTIGEFVFLCCRVLDLTSSFVLGNILSKT